MTEKQKALWHGAVLIPALCCGGYNAFHPKPEPKNKVLALFYGIVVGIEIACIMDHMKEKP